MHNPFLALKSHLHLGIEWLYATTIWLAIMGAVALDWTIVAVSVIGLFTAFTTGYFAYLTAKLKTTVAAVAQVVEDTSIKADIIVEQTEKIHTVTNSSLTEVKSELKNANEQIISLKALVDKLVDSRKL